MLCVGLDGRAVDLVVAQAIRECVICFAAVRQLHRLVGHRNSQGISNMARVNYPVGYIRSRPEQECAEDLVPIDTYILEEVGVAVPIRPSAPHGDSRRLTGVTHIGLRYLSRKSDTVGLLQAQAEDFRR